MAKKIIILLFMMACADMSIQSPDPEVYYKRDMDITVNNITYPGTLVVPRSGRYNMRIKFPGKGDLVLLKTCHREEELEGLGSSERLYYSPTPGLEDTGKCYLEIVALSKKDGRHSWGIVDFQHEMWNLPALVKCNGKTHNAHGVSFCQSKFGLVQEIVFSEKVTLSTKARCYALLEHEFFEDGKTLRFITPRGECTFVIKSESGKLHKLTMIGYEQILLREL